MFLGVLSSDLPTLGFVTLSIWCSLGSAVLDGTGDLVCSGEFGLGLDFSHYIPPSPPSLCDGLLGFDPRWGVALCAVPPSSLSHAFSFALPR